LWSDTNRTIPLLRHRCVVDDQHRIFAADQAIGLNEQFRLQWRRIPEWCNWSYSPGASRAAIGWTLLQSPGPINPEI
jgi:hypothetical protein